MFLALARLTRGMRVLAVADLDPAHARRQLRTAGWDDEAVGATSLGEALADGRTHVTQDAEAVIAFPEIEVIVEATGVPGAGIRHALSAIAHGKHMVMVNVEADALAGPLLARKAKTAGVVYSLAWGDQPALICEHVDWARSCGFNVIAAGKGTRYEPHYHRSTPDTVWDILDKYLQITDRASINPKMFNSFVDGTKSAIEMTAVCDAAGPQRGLCRPVSSHPHDRSRARRLRRERGAAQGADRRSDPVLLRCGRDCEAPPEGGRGARWRGRILCLGQAGSGGTLGHEWAATARAGARGHAQA